MATADTTGLGIPELIPLADGTVTLAVDHQYWPLGDLCTFANRINPRRAFLVVSKVLGRHIPARPAVMRATFRDLAAGIPEDLPGPVLVIGLAETAICLGQGVHEELLRLRPDVAFLHSTRQLLDHPVLCRFEEPHSHASGHLLYRPDPTVIDLGEIRSLVLVDDEVSTGSTLTNLASAVTNILPGIEAIAVATLTDWSHQSGWLTDMPRPASCTSLLGGSLRWQPHRALPSVPVNPRFDAQAMSFGTMAAHRNFGRLGRNDVASDCDRLIDAIDRSPGETFSIICTGEFTYPPFRIAEALEKRGHDVVVQSTTRSPVLLGGPIGSALTFADNYDTGVPNFLYNATAERTSIICHETPPGSIDLALSKAIGGRTLFFGDGS